MFGYGYAFPAPVMTPEQVRSAANRAALAEDGLVESPRELNVPQPASSAVLPRLDTVNLGRLREAAHRARKIYPGPVGACVAAELTCWDELGYRYGGNSSIAKLVEAIMAIPEPDVIPPAA